MEYLSCARSFTRQRKRLQRGLNETGARLTNGQRVASNADAVRWLLERMHEQSNGEEAVGSG